MIALADIDYTGPARPVDGYGPGFFRIEGKVRRGPLLLTPEGPRPWSGWDDRAPLLALAGQVDVLLLGMGRAMTYPDTALVAALEAAGIGVEPMDSPAAARTWNMLLAEGRRVGAALIPV
ncbi:MAG: Mth938-like domain-containing protein [Paracoccaceae bacterium]